MKVTKILVVFVFCICIKYSESATAEDVERLFQDKLSKSNPNIRPVLNQSKPVDITIEVYIVAMTDLNEIQQKVEATVWLLVKWKNELLTWNATEYGDLEVVEPAPETTWRPNIALSNGYNELNPIGLDFVLLSLYHDGTSVWIPGQKVEFLCKIDVTKFPFDKQNCFMDFIDWRAISESSTLTPSVNHAYDTDVHHANSEWEITGELLPFSPQKSNVVLIGHDTVRVRFTMQRKSISLILTVLLPVFLLAFLNVFVFLLPTESGEKLSFAVTVLLSQAVFLSFISSMMPQTSDSISGLSIYIAAQLVLSTLYVLISCWILRLYHRDTKRRPLPSWFLKVVCFNMRNVVKPFGDQDEKTTEAFVDCVATGREVSQRIDKVCFWLFFVVVAFMTALYVFEGLKV
ncbi:hypothetical protein LOTGIDRAFT_114875 [Lottia gigantea]|uniref:Neurotransmitter-gated ion-channel ligand-binding domain-containing protein n=1 Tax=Lottia gigantea TaxID=225164 RepID=V4AUF1_LOTGI|nr:hypothetical protein LOTGIDRAFT_114875 [Lottia gigantea]ESO97386.1 hypothetical protein LOTGIDRAFT_114875 [Lottia gigantea]